MKFQFAIFLILFTLVFVSISHPISNEENYTEVSTNSEDDWWRNLESQIISSPEDLKAFLKGSNYKPEIPGTDATQATTKSDEEAIVVTDKPYLTGGNLDQEQFESTSEQPEEDLKSTEDVQSPEDKKKGGPSYANFKREEDGLHNLSRSTRRSIILSTPQEYLTSAPISTVHNNEDDARRLLDGILAKEPKQMRTMSNSESSRSEIMRDGSEVKSFVVLVKNQTHMIIFGCILTLIVLIAIVLSLYQILTKLNERSNITLIAHYEHDLVNEHGMFQNNQQKV